MYDTSRFFTMTGVRLAAMPTTVCERTAALGAVHQAHVARTEDGNTRETAGTQSSARLERPRFVRNELDDDTLLAKAQRAANGEKFRRLWRGSTAGYSSQSEADLALCCLLAFWTGSDAGQMDRLFRQSGLMRGKWDEVHFADGATYGERTIERAIAGTDERYDG
jgi:primase-polymerase (primpol)-like protein